MPKPAQVARSKTIQFAMLLAIASTLATNMDELTPYLGEYGALAGVVVAMIIAALRAVTDGPLSDK